MKAGPDFKKGAFGEQAARAGVSTAQLAKDALKPGSKATTKTKRRAHLAQTFGKMRRRKA